MHELPAELPDAEVAEVAFQKRRVQSTGSDFLPPHLHRVVVISCVMRDDEDVSVFSLGEPERRRDGGDPALLRRHRQVRASARLVERRAASTCRCW